MICDFGNQTQEVVFPLKSFCSKEFGGKLLDVIYTTSDYYLMFIGCVCIIGLLIFIFFASSVEEGQ